MNRDNDATSVRAVRRGELERLSAKRHLLAVLATAVLASGCASLSRSLSPSDDLVAIQIKPVMHYGAGIVIADYTIDDKVRGGFEIGWGGGGSGYCCVLVPEDIPTQPFMVTVKWETNRQKVSERRKHEATVPVHFEVRPGKGSGLYVHFLPGHRVEAWIPGSLDRDGIVYQGPPYPRGPAPLYQPLPEEKPWPPGTTAEDVRIRPTGA